MTFSPDDVRNFRITSFDADAKRGTASLRYALDDKYEFEERFEFSGGVPAGGSPLGFERAIRLLHMVAGVSYYKAGAPPRIVVETGQLTELEKSFCRDVYDKGLREFAIQNNLPVPREFEITSLGVASAGEGRESLSVSLSGEEAGAPTERVGIPIGGGKDSIVVVEALKQLSDVLPVLVSINPSPAVERIASISGLELVRIKRSLDPKLFDLNDQGALNGHVPVTAIVSLACVSAGYLHNFGTTAIALESSADSPTRQVHGVEVNHQWSKSAEFETQLRRVLSESVDPNLRFVSPLRTMTELNITAAFASLTPYLRAFRSCNRAFRIDSPLDGWCCDCPKCRFVFLALATALPRSQVVEVFGADLLHDRSQLQGFGDMLDPDRKPFECVGTVEEVTAALRQLTSDPSWSGAAVLEYMKPALAAMPDDNGSRNLEAHAVMAGIRRAVQEAPTVGAENREQARRRAG